MQFNMSGFTGSAGTGAEQSHVLTKNGLGQTSALLCRHRVEADLRNDETLKMGRVEQAPEALGAYLVGISGQSSA